MQHHALHALLHQWIVLWVKTSEQDWVFASEQKIYANADTRLFCILYSQVSRHIDKFELNLKQLQQEALSLIIPNWSIRCWTLDQLIRTYFLLSWPQPKSFADLLEQLIIHADTHELIAFYQALPMFTTSASLHHIVVNALRTNIHSIFNAIALNNLYPMLHFSDEEWNQMVLKAIFIDSPIRQIIGLESRTNLELIRMLQHFRDERLAAHRTVPVEIHNLLNAIN